MEVSSKPGIMSGREPFTSGMQKSPVPVPVPPPQLAMVNMRLAYTADGTAVYKPITTSTSPSYQGAAGGSKPITTTSSPPYQGAAGGGKPIATSSPQGAVGGGKPITTSSPPPYQGAAGGGKAITTTSSPPYQGAAGGGKPITTTSPPPYQGAAGGGKPITTTSPRPYQGAAGGGKPITTSSPPPYQGAGGGVKPIATSSSPPYKGAAGEGPGRSAPAAVGSDGPSPAVTPYGLNINASEPVKRKRGRPRKYRPNGSMALALTPVPHAATVQLGTGGFFPSLAGIATSVSSVSAAAMKKARGRPPGSGKKHQMAALGSVGIGFTPHVLTVKAGEDVYATIMSFSQLGPRAICILSANGVISNVTLRQAATSGGTVTYEGRFEILSLSGSFLLSENGGQRIRTGGLSVSLADPDGRVLGGGVAGLLTAASPIQVVVGSFITEGKKESKSPMSPSDPMSAPGMLALGAPAGPSSLPSRGTPSGSSAGPGSPLNQSTGTCNNSNQQGMPNMLWK